MFQWYYIGNGSVFDTDMDFTEKIINYVEVGNVGDIDALVYYYLSSLTSYWFKLEELLSFESAADLIHYYCKSEQCSYKKIIEKNFDQLHKNTKPRLLEYKELFDEKIATLKRSHHALLEDITDQGKFDLIREIYLIFVFISHIGCGRPWTENISQEHTDRYITSLREYIFPLTNDSASEARPEGMVLL